MQILHICNRSTWNKHKNNTIGHWCGLLNDQIIHIGQWGYNQQTAFEQESDVIILPNLLDSTPIGSQAALALAHLGIKETHKTFEAMQIIKKSHAAFTPSQF